MKPILLDGRSLTRVQLEVVAYGAPVALDEAALERVAHAARFLAEQVRREEPIYGVSTGFGSNADRLLGAHPLRDDLPGSWLSSELQLRMSRNTLSTSWMTAEADPRHTSTSLMASETGEFSNVPFADLQLDHALLVPIHSREAEEGCFRAGAFTARSEGSER